MSRYQGIMTIVSHKEIAKDVYEMKLKGYAASYIKHPGQFINIKINDSMTPYLRRPMSICDYDHETITMIYKVVGEGTKLLSEKKVNDTLDCLTGLGNGFIDLDADTALVTGGGLGVPPMYNTAKALLEAGKKVTAVLGFNGKDDAFYIDEFKALCPTYIATMDGSLGDQGNVIDVIKKYDINFDKYYTCGPLPMLNALALAYPEGGYLSYEARMGCGFGACMGCSMKVKGQPYKRVCVEGPVFKSEEVIVNG